MIEVRDYLTSELKHSDYVHGTIDTRLIPDPLRRQTAMDVFDHEKDMETKRKNKTIKEMK